MEIIKHHKGKTHLLTTTCGEEKPFVHHPQQEANEETYVGSEVGDKLAIKDKEGIDDELALHVIQCILAATKVEEKNDWLSTNIFHKTVKCENKVCKLIIDGGNSMNIVSKIMVNKLQLSVEKHPNLLGSTATLFR